MSYVFDELGYRRYEWRTVSFNNQSRKAAERLGFKFERISRQELIYKKCSHDIVWYSITDKKWPQLKAAFQAPDNFDEHGHQLKKLSEFQKY